VAGLVGVEQVYTTGITNSVKTVEASRPKISAHAKPEKIGSVAMAMPTA